MNEKKLIDGKIIDKCADCPLYVNVERRGLGQCYSAACADPQDIDEEIAQSGFPDWCPLTDAKAAPLCACGCGQICNWNDKKKSYSTYRRGHSARNRKNAAKAKKAFMRY